MLTKLRPFVAILALLSACRASPTPYAPSPLPSSTSSAIPSPSTTPSPGKFANLEDITIYFEEHGEGIPLVLIHGGMGSADDWANQIEEFSRHYRVITFDSRGQGRTTDPQGPLSYHLMAEDTLRLMDYLQVQSAYIVGWSDGGIIGIDLANHHPDRVLALVAYGANINLDGVQESVIAYIRDSSLTALQNDQGAEYLRLSPDPAHLPVIVEKLRTLWLTEPNFTQEELSAIRVPTLIIDGQKEEVVRPDHAAEIAAAIPGAELALLPNVGHYALWQQSAEWNRVVLDFLALH